MKKNIVISNIEAFTASVRADSNIASNALAICERESVRLTLLADTLASMKIDCSFLLKVEQTNQRIAVYALQKFTRIVSALAQKNINLCDKYTRATLANLAHSENALSNLSARASLCDTIKHDDALAVRLFKSDTTASTQRSSSAIALHAARVCDYSRDSRSLAFADSENATTMRAILAS